MSPMHPARRRLPAALGAGLVPLLCLALAPAATAGGYRLRAEALANVQSPVGLLVLAAEGKRRPWLDVEAMVWLGAGADSEADALVIAARARSPEGGAEARIGRFVLVAGALRPVHVDGAHVRVRLRDRWYLETFGGTPVVPGFGARAYDWLAGARASRSLGDWGAVGLAYMHQRDRGLVAAEEIGLDAGGAVAEAADVGGRVAVDLLHFGVSEAQVSAAMRRGPWRVELYGAHRSPMRLLPATSLFSVLGDVPSQKLGTVVRWRAAPRLDVLADAGARVIGDDAGVDVSARATLRLNERGSAAVRAELRRAAAPDGGWTGARATVRAPLLAALALAVELEVARPDEVRGRGAVWPWALAALHWQRAGWDAAIAVEASASPAHRYRVDALARVARQWEVGGR